MATYLIIVWTLQTIQYSDCLLWGIQEYPNAGIFGGMLAGFVEYSDNYILIGEYVQAVARALYQVLY